MLKTDTALDYDIPGVPPVPILGWRGNMLRFFRDPLTYLTESQRDYGNVAAFAHGGNGNLLATVENCPVRCLPSGKPIIRPS